MSKLNLGQAQARIARSLDAFFLNKDKVSVYQSDSALLTEKEKGLYSTYNALWYYETFSGALRLWALRSKSSTTKENMTPVAIYSTH